MLTTLIYHEGGHYLDWRGELGLAQLRDRWVPVGSVGIAQIQLGTGVRVASEVYSTSFTRAEMRRALINSDEFSIRIAAGYLGQLRDDFGLTSDFQPFMAYSASEQAIEALKAVDFDVQRLVDQSAAATYIANYQRGPTEQLVDGTYLVSAYTLNALVRREGFFYAARDRLLDAGWVP